ncbi:response regulator transcription factor [Nocardiopsis sp. HNM0947]|uniref:Response regulator transcription factor n=1 Tax=Nocardiopsis coralli TaxID=2772213 RepID=A0ABR9P1E2_9ACTN|nr:response regulator transcription factor [Nocardiopsis coralli]MBE2997652.1 response regulator transcription factor [Nocardiopsis coralli]
MSVSLLLVDDQPLVRAGLRMILESAPDLSVVGEASDAREASREARSLVPDVVLMDLMGGPAGTRAIRAVLEWARPLGHRVRVLALGPQDSEPLLHGALHAGASGFLFKDTPPEELVSAVRVVASGGAVLPPLVLHRLLDEVAPLLPSGEPAGRAPRDPLSVREREVLRLLARGWSNAEIAAHLFVGSTTVKSHVGSILTKLGLRDRVQAVIHAYETGLVRPGEGHANNR